MKIWIKMGVLFFLSLCLVGMEVAQAGDAQKRFDVVSWSATPINSANDKVRSGKGGGTAGYYLAADLNALRITVRYKNPYVRNQDVQVPFNLELIAPNGNRLSNTPKGELKVRAVVDEGSFAVNYGWSSPGNWMAGKYLIRVNIDNSLAGWGEFYVIDGEATMAQAEEDARNGRWLEVQQGMERLIKAQGDNHAAALKLAQACWEQGKNTELNGVLGILQKQQDFYHVQFYKGEMAFKSGDLDMARQHYLAAKEQESSEIVASRLAEIETRLAAAAERRAEFIRNMLAKYTVGSKVEVMQWNTFFKNYGYAGIVKDVDGRTVTLEVCAFINVNQYLEAKAASGNRKLFKGTDIGAEVQTDITQITGFYTGEVQHNSGNRSGASESPPLVSVSADDWKEFFSNNWAVKRLELQNINGYQNQESPGYIINGENNTTITKPNGGAIAGKYRWIATWSNGDEQRTYSGVIYVSGTKYHYRIRLREDGSDAGSGEF